MTRVLAQFDVRDHLGGWKSIKVPGRKRTPDRLQWKREVGAPRERRYVRVAGVGPDIDYVPFTNDLDTLLRGVAERVFFVKTEDGFFKRPPRPKPRVFAQRLATVWDELVPLLPSTAPVSHQNFVDSYSGRKRQLYQSALESMRAGRSTPGEDAKLQIFVKYEKTDRTTKSDPVPRVISPRDPKFNIRVGRYLKPLEHKLFKSIGKMFGHTTVIKGFNAVKSAELLREKWDMWKRPVAIGLDASRFDQHVSKDALAWEHGVYLQCFKQTKHRRRLGQLLDHQLLNKCVGYVPDGEVRYTIEGTRMSGDMNTSLGNCLLMCSMIRAYARHCKVECSLANNGDDCVVFMEQTDLGRFMGGLDTWFLEMGFNMAVEKPVYEFDEVEFCQTKPIFDGSGWIMCRNVHTAVGKDTVMLKNWDGPDLYRGWLDAVGTGGLALAGQLPVFQEVYALYVRSGKKRAVPEDLLPWSFRTLKEGVNRAYGAVHPEARASFYLAFGVTPDEQIALEEYYRGLVLLPDPGPYASRYVFVGG